MNVAVIGAGAVGLACAAELARRGHGVFVFERHGRAGQETSSRNSEVIHAGLYYPEGTLKAQACVEGRKLLTAWCTRHDVPFRLVGKVVVATQLGQVPGLEALLQRARVNGAGDVRMIDRAELSKLEPNVRGICGLFSPETGILDSHAYMDSLRRVAIDHGATFVFNTRLCAVSGRAPLELTVEASNGEESTLEVDWLVNAAGLASDHVASMTGVDVHARRLRLHPCKGDYFALAPRTRGLVSHLVYPMPEAAGLGVHLTMSLDGALRAGPDTAYVDELYYDVDEAKAVQFAEAIQRYLPAVHVDDLSPAYAGIRPKLQGPSDTFRDFVCEAFPEAPRVVQLVGIESPGLTASLSLAARVAEIVER
jgi:L-2-hydroxyglutarate oxidase LhgO